MKMFIEPLVMIGGLGLVFLVSYLYDKFDQVQKANREQSEQKEENK
jgi:hypothetical protein